MTVVSFNSLTVSQPAPTLQSARLVVSAPKQSDRGLVPAGRRALSVLESPAHRCGASERADISSNRPDSAGRLCRGLELPHVVSG
jgi:hypothetical protein